MHEIRVGVDWFGIRFFCPSVGDCVLWDGWPIRDETTNGRVVHLGFGSVRSARSGDKTEE